MGSEVSEVRVGRLQVGEEDWNTPGREPLLGYSETRDMGVGGGGVVSD